MNAAARLVYQGWSTRQLVFHMFFRKTQTLIGVLMLTLLASALGLIYVTHEMRELQASMMARVEEQHRLQLQQGQLLLERGSWTTAKRIQTVAENQLAMTIPAAKSVVIVKE